MRLIPARTTRRERWKNDGGWTTELARSVDADSDFRWRISIAEIESDGPFSSFPGVERTLLLLEGNGIELDIGSAAPQRLTRRFASAHFDGEAEVHCRLLAGATRDFNVMTRRGCVRADVVARPLVGSMLIFAEAAAEWFVHVLAGHATARSAGNERMLGPGDSLEIDFRNADRERVVLDGGGELVLVKFVASANMCVESASAF